MGLRNRLPNTPSAGRREVMAALLNMHGRETSPNHAGGVVVRKSPRRIARLIGKQATAAQVSTVAAADPATFDVSSTNVALTDAGLAEARAHPASRHITF